MSYDLSKLKGVKRQAGGTVVAQCPACAKENRDQSCNHLSIKASGEFNCIVGSASDSNHNRFIRAFLLDGATEEFEFISAQPESIKMDRVFPDEILTKLIPDFSYWAGRGIEKEVLQPLENGLAPRDQKGALSGRSLFPLRNPDGRIIAFTGRLVVTNSLDKKWRHLGPVSKVVWPWRVSGPVIESTKTAILVESPGDTLALLSSDIKPVICLFGLNLFDLTISHLIGAGVNRVFVSLNRDADPRKGQAAADKIARKLNAFVPDVRIRLPNAPYKDWGDAKKDGEAGAAELKAFREEIA